MFVDARKQFYQMVQEYNQANEPLALEREQVYPYLAQLFPVEQYLKNLRAQGKLHFHWDYSDIVQESYRFMELSSSNIRICRHFRYDCSASHVHNYFQLNCVLAGNPIIYCGEEQYIARPGDYFLLAPKVSHWIESNADDIIVLKIYIRYSTFENTFFRLLGEQNVLTAFFRQVLYGGENRNNFICFQTGDDPWLREHLLETFRLFLMHGNYTDIVTECRITELFCSLLDTYIDTFHIGQETGSNPGVVKILAYMNKQYLTATLENTAVWAGYSKNYLCRLLKNATGKTFTELLGVIRIEKACQLLISTTLSITEICSRTGYGSIKHFYRVFRECMGTTPQQYRRQFHDRQEE